MTATWRLMPGDCIEVMATLPEASVDSIVCDPPYGLGFMGKEWDSPGGTGDFPMRRTDATNTVNTGASRQGGRQRSTEDFAKRQARDARSYQEWCEAWAREALRVLKPGGHILACGGTRTYHRLATGIEDAGFEVRDMIEWLYGSGFPKSLDVSKAIDKAAGAEREVLGPNRYDARRSGTDLGRMNDDGWVPSPRVDTAPATPDSERWQGWGTALKPAHEPICVARKSLMGTVAANVLAHGTGAINVDGCRIEFSDNEPYDIDKVCRPNTRGVKRGESTVPIAPDTAEVNVSSLGRWPANVVLDGDAAAMLDEQTGTLTSGVLSPDHQRSAPRLGGNGIYGAAESSGPAAMREYYGDSGGASRFLYVAKPDQEERNVGLHGQRNPHPTVKPMDLMRWLCRLVTPPGGTVLDPFTGSGTTGIAALREGFSFIGIEREAEYIDVARARIVGDAPLINSVLEEAA